MENRLIAGHRPKPGVTFHLGQSSLKKIHAVVRAYYVVGHPATLEEVERASEQSRGTVHSMQGFLVDIGILGGTSKRKQLCPLGAELGKAIKSRKGDTTINQAWKRIVCQNGFCIQTLRAARAEGKTDKNRFIYLVFTAAGYRPRDLSHDYTTGAKALISIFRRAGLVRRSNGYYTVSKGIERLAADLHGEARKAEDYISPQYTARLEGMQEEGHGASAASKLLAYCSEVNDNYRRGNRLSVALLCEAILEDASRLSREATAMYEPVTAADKPADPDLRSRVNSAIGHLIQHIGATTESTLQATELQLDIGKENPAE